MVRNFYIRGNIDGRKTELTGGSSRRDGGMRLILTQRDNRLITNCLTIECTADGDDLLTVVYDSSGNAIYKNKTRR